jgi:hypothetical protein
MKLLPILTPNRAKSNIHAIVLANSLNFKVPRKRVKYSNKCLQQLQILRKSIRGRSENYVTPTAEMLAYMTDCNDEGTYT